MTDPDLPIERRAATAIGDTASVPAGTLVTVPSAPPTGSPGTAPVVGANTVSKWEDPVFLLSLLTAVSSTAASVFGLLPAHGAAIDWIVTGPLMFMAVLNGVTAFLRTQINTVTK